MAKLKKSRATVGINNSTLIQKVQRYKILWLLETDGYKDTKMKDGIWLELEKELNFPGIVTHIKKKNE